MGSQAILAEHPDCPGEFMVSNEADVCPVHDEELKDLITGSLGEGSRFERTFGYAAKPRWCGPVRDVGGNCRSGADSPIALHPHRP